MWVPVVGAMNMLGHVILQALEERSFTEGEINQAASVRSAGSTVTFRGKAHKVVSVPEAVEMAADIAFCSAGGDVSRAWAPRFAAVGTRVIDNSSAWRMGAEILLVVPEINADAL